MARQHIHGQPDNDDGDFADDGLTSGQAQINTAGTDDLLDEIDGLLETNAEEFVRSFVQKGGE
ncbi:ubiquitin-like protein Pup [Corynebacterium cystitidis]|uniref:ubiquitin-like protein Pup n=1 Tax=Corynebacterium cystitidis TaxID=35757 RepID=UPI00211DCCBB|nr:ubiquitin-like protein Pup [Corynebacterium cystitidis]